MSMACAAGCGTCYGTIKLSERLVTGMLSCTLRRMACRTYSNPACTACPWADATKDFGSWCFGQPCGLYVASPYQRCLAIVPRAVV